MLKVKKIIVGNLATNCYVIEDVESGEVAVIDPGAYSSELEETIKGYDREKVKYIILTHGHFDHIGYAYTLANENGSKIIIGQKENNFTSNPMLNLSGMFYMPCDSFKADIEVNDSDIIKLGKTNIKVIETPGHTMGSISLIADNKLFTGDTLMKCSMGRVDFPTGNLNDMKKSLKKLANLNGDYNVYCGHGEDTTLEYERKYNNYLGI